ncbi:hypothetical protein ACFL5Q_03780 [Planctomycetota bacterium]
MSADLHLNIEYRFRTDKMRPVIAGNYSRIGGYDLFAALTGARNFLSKPILIPPRGFPRDACWALKSLYYWQILDSPNEEPRVPNHCTKKEATKYARQANVEERTIGTVNFISNPDFHHATYLTRAETIAACEYSGYDISQSHRDFQIALDILSLVDSHYGEGASRFVLWVCG